MAVLATVRITASIMPYRGCMAKFTSRESGMVQVYHIPGCSGSMAGCAGGPSEMGFRGFMAILTTALPFGVNEINRFPIFDIIMAKLAFSSVVTFGCI